MNEKIALVVIVAVVAGVVMRSPHRAGKEKPVVRFGFLPITAAVSLFVALCTGYTWMPNAST